MPTTLKLGDAIHLLADHFHLSSSSAGNNSATLIADFENRTVLVTGAAGSIGAELTGTLLAFGAAKVVALDQDENALFDLQRRNSPSLAKALCPILGDLRDRCLVQSVFTQHHPQIVLHAAAYKHVAILEDHPAEAVLNNLVATRLLLHGAIEAGCERFLFVSTDKAVKPISVLGATKRAAELLILDAAERTPSIRLGSIRFGNVLGSSGSALPIFLQQITDGGPITVTHPEMTRYFLTVERAAQLILQAATIASRGEVIVPKLGSPARIVDLARQLIRLHGMVPDQEIKVEFTSPRAGERLHEELTAEARLLPTLIADLYREPASTTRPDFLMRLDSLEAGAQAREPDEVIRRRLFDLARF